MSEELHVDLELDLRGLLCPMPMVKVGQRINDIPIGGILRAVATDSGSMADIPAWARSTDNEIVSAEQVDDEYVFLVRRLS